MVVSIGQSVWWSVQVSQCGGQYRSVNEVVSTGQSVWWSAQVSVAVSTGQCGG